MRRTFLSASVIIVSLMTLSNARGADAAALPRADLDGRARRVLADAVNAGAAVFNAGDHGGCYRLYQGTLMALQPLLDHRPGWQDRIARGLERARGLRSPTDQAFALREVMDGLSAALAQEATGSPARKPLWERLGGEPAVKAVIHDFVAAAAADPRVNFTRGGQFPVDAAGVTRLERKLVELVSAVAGGPLKYTGRDMKSSHAGMKITDAEFDALAGHLLAVLKKYRVPQAEIDELMTVVGSTRKDIVEK